MYSDLAACFPLFRPKGHASGADAAGERPRHKTRAAALRALVRIKLQQHLKAQSGTTHQS